APMWSNDPTPPGRVRIVHNPGLACGTGEHPCTQLALAAMERQVKSGSRVADIGAGSGILSIAAVRLGARFALGVDTDVEALTTARENFALNQLSPMLLAGSADCLAAACSDLTVANINGSVLLAIMDDLQRITRRGGRLILTGFTASELPVFRRIFQKAEVCQIEQWTCVVATSAS
ncbi:MAG: 50S ribosomal protein L11 methyltransferase, partial [Acidobacteriaceae bacterium]|nr:50S ribosomal protein L11 methyltransferase [Acidobacteriaceae bacterium]